MTVQMRPRVKYVIGPDGSPLTIADLPPKNTRRWVIRRKAEVVAAVRGGLLSLEEACARYTLSVDEFRGELTDILDSGPTFHAVLHGGQFDGQVMELDPKDFDADMICAAVDETDADEGAAAQASALPSLYRVSSGEPAPGATVHYQFGGLVSVDADA